MNSSGLIFSGCNCNWTSSFFFSTDDDAAAAAAAVSFGATGGLGAVIEAALLSNYLLVSIDSGALIGL